MSNSNVQQSNRYRELDIAKGIAILSVVIVHIPSTYSIMPVGITWHLSTFFFVSGILEYLNKSTFSIKEYIMKKSQTLLKPYIILSIIYIVFNTIISLISGGKTHIFRNIYLFLSFIGIGTLWFLPTMFGALIVFYFILKKFRTVGIIVLQFVSVGLIFFSQIMCNKGYFGNLGFEIEDFALNQIVWLLQLIVVSGYISFGYFIGSLLKRLDSISNKNIVYLVLSVVLFTVNYAFYQYYIKNNLLYLKIENGLSFIICTVCGGLAVICLSKVLKNISFLKLFEYCGKNSIIIMTTHLEYRIIDLSIFLVTIIKWSALCNLLVFVITLIIELLICYFYSL